MPVDASRDQQSAASSQPHADGSDDGYTRLHITPLDADLLKIVVPASVLPKARNISFHTIATFPENRFGFVDLPQADANKLRAKLNGAVLKGAKMRVEKARKETREEPAGEDTEVCEKNAKPSGEEGTKKRKRDINVVDGVTLTDRKVKRGWTEATDHKSKKKRKDASDKTDKKKEKKEKKKRVKSKYTDQDECLLKVKVPANAAANLPAEDPSQKKKRKNKGRVREVTVHEFEHTTKFPSFLKDASSASSKSKATEFVEGKGWVDGKGNVVESVAVKARPEAPRKQARHAPADQVEEEDSDTSSSGTSSEDESEDKKPSSKTVPAPDSESDTSSDEEDDEDDEPAKAAVFKTPKSTAKADASRPVSSSSTRSLKITIPPPDTPSTKHVHPLEALYKRNKTGDAVQTPAKDAEPFTFFGGGDEEEDQQAENDHQTVAMPMTPFSRQDFERRTIRSAAPTPDTAHPTRMQNFWPTALDIDEELDAPELDDGDEDGDEDMENGEEQAVNGTNGTSATTDFQAWFWENRRDLNKSWMTRRKTVAKEKRHRENKARASKAV
jgi:hypothetical protein